MHLTPDKWKNNHRFLLQEVKKYLLSTPRVTKAFEFSIKSVCQGGNVQSMSLVQVKNTFITLQPQARPSIKKIFYDFLKGIDFPLTRSIFLSMQNTYKYGMY